MKTLLRYQRLVLPIVAAAALLIAVSGCENAASPTGSAQDATIQIYVPNVAPWLQDKVKASSKEVTPQAWMIADEVSFELIDEEFNYVGDTSVYVLDVFTGGVDAVTDWQVTAGNYYLYSFVYNYSSDAWITYGDWSAWGVFPNQDDLYDPVTPFNLAPGEIKPIVITNYPYLPEAVDNDTTTITYSEQTYGEKWFTATTGPADFYMYIDVYGYSPDGANDADIDLYLFGPDGIFLAGSNAVSDGDPATDDIEVLESSASVGGFAVLPDSTYYIAVHAYAAGSFDMYFFTSP